MIEQLLAWDQNLFYLINHSHLPLFDSLMPFYRHKLFWAPLYIFLVSFMIWNFPKNGLWMLLFSVLTVGISDTVSSKIIKNSVQRLRPCNDPVVKDQVVLRVRCGGGYSFTSSHATNHAALALFIFFLFREYRKFWSFLLLAWAISIGIAQIYVGVHYPVDVIVGLFAGAIVGTGTAYTFHRIFRLE